MVYHDNIVGNIHSSSSGSCSSIFSIGGYHMNKLDYFFGDYKLYRRIIGGTWYFIRLNVGIDCVFFWSRSDLKCSERYIVKTEEY